MNLLAKMLNVINELTQQSLETEVTDSSGKPYKVTLEEAVVSAVKASEAANGIFSYPHSIQRADSTLKRTSMADGVCKTYAVNKVDVTLQYRFVNVEQPEEYIDIPGIGTGIDYGDKAPGKAYTYACKYALMKAYKIPSGGKASVDDPDVQPSSMQDAMTGVERTPAPAEVPFENPLIPKADTSDFTENLPPENMHPEDELPPDGIPTNVAQAKKVICTVSNYRDKTFGEIYPLDQAERLFKWYEGKNKPKGELEAARILLAEKQKEKA